MQTEDKRTHTRITGTDILAQAAQSIRIEHPPKKRAVVILYCLRCGAEIKQTAYEGDNYDSFIEELKYLSDGKTLCQPCKISYELLREELQAHREEELKQFWNVIGGPDAG
jgi:hypothetical protein